METIAWLLINGSPVKGSLESAQRMLSRGLFRKIEGQIRGSKEIYVFTEKGEELLKQKPKQ